MLKQIADNSNITDLEQLTELFRSGCKTDEKVGIEFEKLAVYSNSHKAVKYEDIARFMMQFPNINWGKWNTVYKNNHVLGLKNGIGLITLEPGSQFELSLNPVGTIEEIKNKIDKYNEKSAFLAQNLGITWLGYGIQPVSTYKNIKIIPKTRYEYMSEYLPTMAKKPLVMMRETAGIQVGIDYQSEEDSMKKLSLALKLSPIVSAIYANSPIRNGKLTNYKSYRAFSWLHTDEDRCGLISSKLFKKNPDFSFEDYANVLLNVPMLFIERNNFKNGTIQVKNLTFSQFLREGYNGYSATIEDWDLHSSLYFPEVRLKSFLEIRNHDNQKSDLISSIPAFWKGLMYNPDAIAQINSMLEKFTYLDFQYMRHKTPKVGLDLDIRGRNLWDLAKEIVNISYQSLKMTGEESYLEPIKSLVDLKITPADILIENWNGIWNKDISKLVEYSALK